MKKTYISPKQITVKLKTQHNLLTVSSNGVTVNGNYSDGTILSRGSNFDDEDDYEE